MASYIQLDFKTDKHPSLVTYFLYYANEKHLGKFSDLTIPILMHSLMWRTIRKLEKLLDRTRMIPQPGLESNFGLSWPWQTFCIWLLSYNGQCVVPGFVKIRQTKAVWYVPHSHLAIGQCTIHQQLFDSKYLSCKFVLTC